MKKRPIEATRIITFLLRISLGWIYLYSGLTKLMDPAWSAAGYLQTAKTFPAFYAWLATPGMMPTINALNAWGMTLIGIALFLGIFVRLASWSGVLLMVLYYLVILSFPYVGKSYFLIDEHIIFSLVLLYLAAAKAGKIFGLEAWVAQSPIYSRYSKLRAIIG